MASFNHQGRWTRFVCRDFAIALFGLGLLALLGADVAGDDATPEPKGLGDPGQLQSISIDIGRLEDGTFLLSGRDAAQQLIVTGKYATGQVRDLTRDAQYAASPEGIVSITKDGYVTPVGEGEATVHIKSGPGPDLTLKVRVTNLVKDTPVNFPNQVTPVFTKYSCNGGGCHGKSGGQNGFALSLLGFEPQEDFEYLVREARGRRLFPAAPDRSLLLRKISGRVPHGGGHRIDVGSPAYNIVRRWIEQGMPYGSPDDPTVDRIEVLPRERLMDAEASQQVTVVAHYTDGTKRDVTRMTQFESNDAEMAEASITGLVTTGHLAGSVAVMARYQSQVDVFRATVPLGAPVENLPPTKNFIDELVFEKLKQLGLPASDICDDATFIRRTTLDVCGRLPTVEEATTFVASTEANKREKLLERLLDSQDYADYFANKWSAVLRNKRSDKNIKHTTFAFHDWIRNSIYNNRPYDEFVREVIAAAGEAGVNAPVTWYHEVKDQSAQVEDTAQLFLGLRIQCARCHHHPFEKWSQQDYYGLSAFYAQVGRKGSKYNGKDSIFHKYGKASAKNPKTGESVSPTPLGLEPLDLPPEVDPRQKLAEWFSAPDNPFFAKALVNRYWKHFFGRGLVDPEDDMRVTNPAVNPALLDALAKNFIETKFDLKQLVRTICTSQVYGLSAEPNAYNQSDKQNFSRYYPKRLNAEVLLDAIDSLTSSQSRFSGVPAGTRAVQLPDNAFDSYFLSVFGRPDSASACECERSSDVNLAQCLHLLNSSEVQGKVAGGRASSLAGGKDSHEDRIKQLYLVAFSREPDPEETRVATEYIEKHKDNAKGAYEDLLWVIINTKEFMFNH
ncbi:MAG: DUF1549 and DUF1553 domain-containing protein [Pirellulales bacterium]